MSYGAAISRTEAILVAIGALITLLIGDGFFKHSLPSYSLALFWAFDFLEFVLLPSAALFLLYRNFQVKPSQYGLKGVAENESWGHFVGLLVFLALILDLIYYVTLTISWGIFQPETSSPFYSSLVPKGVLHFPVALYFALTAGVTEEVFFRGLPLLFLRERFSASFPKSGYVLGSAVLFAAGHWENGPHEVVGTFFYGVLSGILYLRLRDLWPFICAHALVDFWGFT